MNLKTTVGIVLGAAAIALPVSAQLFTENYDVTSGAPIGGSGQLGPSSAGAGSYGFFFTPTANLTLTEIGIFDLGGFSSGTARVELWAQGGVTPVDSLTANLSDAGSGGDGNANFEYIHYNGFSDSLTSGVQYALIWRDFAGGNGNPATAQYLGAKDGSTDPSSLVTTASYAITLDHKFSHLGLGLTGSPFIDFASIAAYSTPNLSVNMTLAAAVPEPSTYAAISGLGLLGFAALRRFRR